MRRQRNVKKKEVNTLLENIRKSRKRLNASAGIVMKPFMRIRGKTTDTKMWMNQPDLRQCRTAQAVKFDTGEFGTRNKKEIASNGEKKKREKNTHESVAQEKGDAKGRPAVINALKKRTQGVPDVKSSRSSKRTRSGCGGNSTKFYGGKNTNRKAEVRPQQPE